MAARSELKVGLIGYGAAGAAFHVPLIRAAERLSLAAVATSRAEAAQIGLPVVSAPEALIYDPDIELVVVATPNDSHFPLAQAALRAGKHVVVDKPFTVDVAEAEALIALANQHQRLLTVFHNRRWDGDFLTVQRLIAERALGEVLLYEARWDRFRPSIKQGWREESTRAGGLLADLGPHLIDQALLLFGMPEALSADIAVQRPGAIVDDYFEVTLYYGRARAVLSASNLVAAPRPRFAVHGNRGSFVKHGLDPQEAALKAGGMPCDPGFGEDTLDNFGLLTSGDGTEQRIETESGRYVQFYERVGEAILAGGSPPVELGEVKLGLQIIELSRRSAAEGRRLQLT